MDVWAAQDGGAPGARKLYAGAPTVCRRFVPTTMVVVLSALVKEAGTAGALRICALVLAVALAVAALLNGALTLSGL